MPNPKWKFQVKENWGILLGHNWSFMSRYQGSSQYLEKVFFTQEFHQH